MDLSKLVGGLSKSGALSGFMGGVAGGGLTSMVTSKKGRKVGKSALKVGALAAVGGLAWKAYQQYSANKGDAGAQQAQSSSGQNASLQNTSGQNTHYSSQGQVPSHASSPNTYNAQGQMQNQAPKQSGGAQFDFRPAALPQQAFEEVVDEDNEQGQMLLMRAMIAAAYADGHIDEAERQRIFAQVENMDLSVQEKATLFDELRKPLSLQDLVSQVPDAQTGIEVYAASASAIDSSQEASQVFLNSLSSQLCIPSELVGSIHQQLSEYQSA